VAVKGLRWQDQAACKGMDVDLFFADQGGTVAEARMACNGNTNPKRGQIRPVCPVRLACLRYAVELHDGFGLKGGLTAKERRGLTLADLDEAERRTA
jgi:WhiB family transcriptional regulator, redox-sensing transcriptional regulator